VPRFQPSTTTSPCRASSAAITRPRGSRERISGTAMVPRMTLAAPRSSQRTAAATSRMPPPTRQANRATSRSTSAALLPPVRIAASRSITAISPATLKRSAMGSGSPASIAFSAPPTSWTVWPPWRSIEGTITTAGP
jgi:hypothetical protein